MAGRSRRSGCSHSLVFRSCVRSSSCPPSGERLCRSRELQKTEIDSDGDDSMGRAVVGASPSQGSQSQGEHGSGQAGGASAARPMQDSTVQTELISGDISTIHQLIGKLSGRIDEVEKKAHARVGVAEASAKKALQERSNAIVKGTKACIDAVSKESRDHVDSRLLDAERRAAERFDAGGEAVRGKLRALEALKTASGSRLSRCESRDS